MTNISLRQTGSRWEFKSEAALEDFVWDNLEQLLRLTPLKRQYFVQGQKCDILAINESKRLVVLELKNIEDRYIVQQLTRYYDALLKTRPFEGQVEYTQPPRLIGVTPNIHKDNLIDRKHHKLSFCFLECAIAQAEKKFFLQLKDVDTEEVSKVEIPYREQDNAKKIPIPPRPLYNLLTKCSDVEREGIWRVREKILKFDSRMQEVADAGNVKYGRGKGKLCAELRFDNLRNSSALFLWLPHVSTWRETPFIARMRVWTDWKSVSDVGHVPKAVGRMITETEWKSKTVRPLRKLVRGNFLHSNTHKSPIAMKIPYYIKLIGKSERLNSLDTLVDMALEKWLERL